MKRLLNPQTAPNAWMAGAAAVIAVITGLQAHHHIPAATWLAAAVFVASLASHFLVTPVKDPRDGHGKPLAVTPKPAAVITPPPVTGTGPVSPPATP